MTASTLANGPRVRVPPAVRGLPLVGCAYAFGRDPSGFLAKARAAHGDVFQVPILKRRMTFLLDPRDVPRVLKAGEVLAFRPLADEIGMRVFALTPHGAVVAAHPCPARARSSSRSPRPA